MEVSKQKDLLGSKKKQSTKEMREFWRSTALDVQRTCRLEMDATEDDKELQSLEFVLEMAGTVICLVDEVNALQPGVKDHGSSGIRN